MRVLVISPVGILLIVAFCVFLVVAILIDRNTGKKFEAEFNEKYHIIDSLGKLRITDKYELIRVCPSGTLPGYKKWNLSEIGSISANFNEYSICDHNMQAMRGEYLTPSKKPVKESSYICFNEGAAATPKEVQEFLKKYANHISYAYLGEIQEN